MIRIITSVLFSIVVITALLLPKNIKEIINKSIVQITEENVPTKVRTVEELGGTNSTCVVLDFIGIVEQYGYTGEEYSITTEDGYILKIHRVSGSPSSPKKDGKPVVFLNPGLFSNSDFFVLHGPDYDLVYLLADKGYDIWLANPRGTSYSNSNVKYSHLDPKFWDFSLDEQTIDTSKFLDFVLQKTGQDKLTFIGFSMGTTESYMLLSSKCEYNDKINLLISLAPVVYMAPPMNLFLRLLIKTTTEVAGKLNIKEILPQSCITGEAGDTFCSAPEPNICSPVAKKFSDPKNINISYTLPKYLKYFPAGSCYHTIEHYNQMIEAKGKFQKYSYPGKRSETSTNLEKYNQTNPPEYDVSLVTVPVVLFCALNDIFVPVKNAKLLKKRLPNVVSFNFIRDKKFNHLDFVWNVNARNLVYDPLIDIMTRRLEDQKV